MAITNEMKAAIQEHISWNDFQKEVINSPNWIISLDEDDLLSFSDDMGTSIHLFGASTTDISSKRMEILTANIINQITEVYSEPILGMALLIFIQFPLSIPIQMDEMGYINDIVDKVVPIGIDCDIKWGLSPREDKTCRIICSVRTI